MKFKDKLAVLCLLMVGASCVKLEHDGDIYDTIDLKKVVEDDGLFSVAYDCLMDLGPCREEHQIIRDYIPNILRTKCGDCNASQKAVFEYTAGYIEKNRNDKYKAMFEKYGQ